MADEQWFDWWQRNGRDPGNMVVATVAHRSLGKSENPTEIVMAESPDPQEIVIVGSILSRD